MPRPSLLLLAALVAGCGSSVTADQACSDLSHALCTQLSQCAPPLITSVYGDVATCETRAKLNCVPSLMAPSTSATPDKLDHCATAVTTLSCNALFTRDTPAACKPDPGKLVNGSACGDDAQCTSAYCKKAAGQVCGVCGMRSPAGVACSVDDDCDFTLACAMSVCVAHGAVGATCDGGHPCATPNVCKGGVCATPAGAGQPCDPVVKDCDATQALYCNPTTRICAQATFAGAGQPCGLVNGGFVGCSGSGHCKLGAASLMGTCLAPAADGAACDSTNGPDCVSPAQCIGAVCKLPNPAGCM
ncbi:MAG: hypothetical protein ACXVDD_10665 [Polyangia bacterium]